MTAESKPSPDSWIPLWEWRVRNFKSVAEANLEFAPLTLLVGPNSSGKSTIIQSILLMVQAAQAETEGDSFPLNGALTSLGGYGDVKYKLAKKASVSLGGNFVFSESNIPGIRGLHPRPSRPLRQFRRAFPPSIYGAIDFTLSFDRGSVDEPGSADISSVQMQVDLEDENLTFLHLKATRRGEGEVDQDLERIRLGKLTWPTREDFALGFEGTLETSPVWVDSVSNRPQSEGALTPVLEQNVKGLALRAGIPHNVATTWELGRLAAQVWVESRTVRPLWQGRLGPGLREMGDDQPEVPREGEAEALAGWAEKAAKEISHWHQTSRDQPVTLASFLGRQKSLYTPEQRRLIRTHARTLVDEIARRIRLVDPVFAPPEWTIAASLNEPAAEVHRFLSERVVYLGPLREDPNVTYRSTPSGASGYIGTKGEYMASILHAGRTREVACPMEDGSLKSMRLADALNYWVQRLDLADSVSTRDLARLGIQVSVSRGDVTDLDLTSVGVGVSQLLPVVVTCLVSPPGSLILLEQPELHLHPAVQQRLGDFFIACSKAGRQLIVETHSEYLLGRLRLRIATDHADQRQIAVIFAEQINGESKLRPVKLNELGGIDDWPEGFFDQSAEESKAILQAGLGKKLRPAPVGEEPGE